MKRFDELMYLASKVSSSRELELVYTLTDDAVYCGNLTDEQCCRIYEVLENAIF